MNEMMASTHGRIVGFLMVLTVVLALVPTSVEAAPEIVSISALPAEPRSDQDITINATVQNLENVTGVKITYCTDTVCSIPISMVNHSGTFTYTFMAHKFPPGYVGFNITVDYTENATHMKVSRELDLTVLEGAAPPPKKDDGNETPGFGAGLVVAALLAVTALSFRRRR